tara:strand:- start:78 stop:488 length:411 start_codon:yes stop_codon:yes gene_type:complete
MKNNNTNTPAYNTDLVWNAGTILQANFMFPTHHFESLNDLESMPKHEFYNTVISLIEPFSLSDLEKSAMFKATQSENRLRMYYMAESIAISGMQVKSEAEFTEENEDDLTETFSNKGYSIQTDEEEFDNSDLDQYS